MTDTATVRIVVVFLGVLSVIYAVGLIWLVSTGTTPDRLAIITGIAGGVTGSLATLLVSTRSGPTGQLSTTVETTTSTSTDPPAQTAAIPLTSPADVFATGNPIPPGRSEVVPAP